MEYQINGGQAVPGYPTSGLDPVFRYEVNNLTDWKVFHNQNITDEVFNDLIYTACLRFNPFGKTANYKGEGRNFHLDESEVEETV